jgi:hypothetical protein
VRAYAHPIAILLTAFLADGALYPLCQPATVSDISIRNNAIRAAEQFVKNNKLDTKRTCPKALRARDAQRTMEDEEPPLCQPYSASESKAYAIINMEEYGWLVFFRKRDVDPELGRPLSRRIDVLIPNQWNNSGRVCLYDLEGDLPAAEILLDRE